MFFSYIIFELGYFTYYSLILNLIIYGTRPEAIKMTPLVKEFVKNDVFETRVCVTTQHRSMFEQVFDFFEIKPDYDLNLMKPGQILYGLTAAIITGLQPVLEEFQPDYVYVHGVTTTNYGAQYRGIQLRSNNLPCRSWVTNF